LFRACHFISKERWERFYSCSIADWLRYVTGIMFCKHGITFSPSQVEDLSAYLQFKTMSKNKMAAPTAGMKQEDTNFMRKGQVGDCKNYLKEEQQQLD
jgi:hypothetical protein